MAPAPVRTAVRDAAGAFLLSRLIVVATLVPGSLAWDRYPSVYDAGFYQAIAQYGYTGNPNPDLDLKAPAFFPLLPLLEHLGGLVGGSHAAWGIVIGAVTTFAALVLLHRVTEARFGVTVARLAVFAVALFPFSYVFTTGYTEGLFLLLSVAAYALVVRGAAAGSAVAAFLAGLVRPTGVLLAPAFAVEAWRHPRRRVPAIAAAVAAAAGTLAYFLYLWHVRDDLFASLHAQQAGWARSVGVTSAPRALVEEAWDAITWPRLTFLVYLTGLPLCIGGLVVLWRAGVRDGPFAFALLGLLAPISTGSFMSLPRFAMATFPYAWAAGLALARLGPRGRVAVLIASAAGLVACTWATYWRVTRGLAP